MSIFVWYFSTRIRVKHRFVQTKQVLLNPSDANSHVQLLRHNYASLFTSQFLTVTLVSCFNPHPPNPLLRLTHLAVGLLVAGRAGTAA